MSRYTFSGLRKILSTKSLSNHIRMLNNSTSSTSVTNTVQSTVDSEDVKRHAKQADEWWNPSGTMKLLHTFNLLRVPFIRDGLVPPSTERKLAPLSNKSILDVGCGGGILTEALARIGANMTGIDASRELVDVAKQHSVANPKLLNHRPTYYCTTIEEHSEKFCNHYDAVVASEIIEHVTDKELFVKSCIKTLKPGGKIFITTPSRTRLAQIFIIYLSEYVCGIVPKGTHEYEKFMTPNELTFLLERNNCHVELIHGIVFNVLTNKWSFISSTDMIFAIQAVKYEAGK
ncbi:ubiquinone biosynthesis O-methyltransferase, mitochondrial-like [Danaus plexippus]|uniref:ubiquinone biosynthesis O-methyltransferase, mitochondrial-like n=1 Tax=Danaus plexippus TaxID=13037 RepID=UPI002AB153B6|nr:ubiquinone biosynthesis O-methyltransferase, mitochondrial-like [Danaus plexippus]